MKPESHRAKLTWRHLFKILQGAINQTLNFSVLNAAFFCILFIYKGEFREITTQLMHFTSFHCKHVHSHGKNSVWHRIGLFSYSSTFSSLAWENNHKYGRGSTNGSKVSSGVKRIWYSIQQFHNSHPQNCILSHNSQNTWTNIHFGLCVNMFMV